MLIKIKTIDRCFLLGRMVKIIDTRLERLKFGCSNKNPIVPVWKSCARVSFG